LWAAQKLIHITPGNQVDYGFVRNTIKDLSKVYDIREIGFDRWNATQIVQQLMDDGLTMVPIGQGFQSMNAPTSELLAMVADGRLQHGGNPVLSWMADCMTVKQDPAGNVKPVKPDRMKSKKRIDGMVAVIDGLARFIVQDAKSSVYETRGILGL
jgi:phage terminase large subunit-like protein